MMLTSYLLYSTICGGAAAAALSQNQTNGKTLFNLERAEVAN